MAPTAFSSHKSGPARIMARHRLKLLKSDFYTYIALRLADNVSVYNRLLHAVTWLQEVAVKAFAK